MTTDLDFDPHSLDDLERAWRAAPEPDLDQLVGVHEAEFLGPFWLRHPAPYFMAATGMPNWWGKRFERDGDDPESLSGMNLLGSTGDLRERHPMSARVEDSGVDGRPALVIRYPPSSSWPWRSITDQLRPVGDDVLLLLTVGLPATTTKIAPFIAMRRQG